METLRQVLEALFGQDYENDDDAQAHEDTEQAREQAEWLYG